MDDICLQTYKPIECILSISEIDKETSKELENKYKNKLRDSGIEFKIIWDSKRRNAGPNRNSGAEEAKGDYISFIDADDSILPYRLEVINYFLEKNHPNLLLHNFYRNANEIYPEIINKNEIKYILNEEISKQTFPKTLKRNRNKEILNKIKPPIKVPGYYSYHHGAVTVKKEVFNTVQYTTAIRGQDCIFCRDVLEQLGGLIYIDIKLMIYN
jgi:glycosyltransferase involved in cell wall biosynthesis